MGSNKGKGKYNSARSGGGVLDKSIVDSIMLRFRPIAPKPAGNGSSSSEATPESKNNVQRTKRKYVRVRKNNRPRKKKKTAPSPEEGAEMIGAVHQDDKSFVTLHLLPERSDGEDLKLLWSNVIESRVTVESVMDTCAGDGELRLGLTDGDRLRSLEADTCPGFVSDGFDTVRWVNEAYKKMLMSGEENDGIINGLIWKKEFRVFLVMKERFPCSYYSYPGFGCRVRVDYTWRDRKLSQTSPCDVWRMECGWFAWRLDVKSALSLSI